MIIIPILPYRLTEMHISSISTRPAYLLVSYSVGLVLGKSLAISDQALICKQFLYQ